MWDSNTYKRNPTFESENSGVRVHQRQIGSNWASQGLVRRVHVHDHNAILRRSFSNANELVRFHRHMRKRNELGIYSNTGQLQQQKHPKPTENAMNTLEYSNRAQKP